MSADETGSLQEKLLSLAAACDEALAAGDPRTIEDLAAAPPEMRSRLERGLACLQLLQQLRPGPGPTSSSPAPDSSSEAPRCLGRFQIRRELGRGGFGVVFLAYDPQLCREVALKVPRAEALVTPELRERFRYEAQAAAGLDHPNLVPVYEAGEVGPICYIASAYCPGIDLAAWIKARGEPVSFPVAAVLVARLAEAVQHAHQRGVLHRDLKPSNVLLETPRHGPAGGGEPEAALGFVPRITDFGLAKILQGEGCANQTRSGTIAGTPSYMAPEQAVGSTLEIGPATDVHALGAILYEVLTGRPPYQAETVLDTLAQVRSEEPISPTRLRPTVPRDLETICLKCLQKVPIKRYDSAQAMADDLRRFLSGQAIQARPVGWMERTGKWVRRNRVLAGALATVALSLIVGTIVAWWLALQANHALGQAERARQERARAQVDTLLNAEPQAVPALLTGLEATRPEVLPLLKEAYAQAQRNNDRRKQLNASLALLPGDPAQKDYLEQCLLGAAPHEVAVLRDALTPHKQELVPKLWALVGQPVAGRDQERLRAACALARYDPDSPRWAKIQDQVASDLVGVPAVYLAAWLEAMRPVARHLQAPLARVFRDGKRRETERSLAADILAEYAAAQPDVLADLLLDASDRQFAVLFAKLKGHGERGPTLLQSEVEKQPSADARGDDRERLAKRQANAAATLLKLERGAKVWPLLAHRPDPRVRSYLIHRLGPLGVDARVLLGRLDQEPDVAVRRALVLSLGEFTPDKLPLAERQAMLPKLLQLYRDPDPGLRGAAEWLLRHWKHDEPLKEIDRQGVKQKQQRLQKIRAALRKDKDRAKPQWYLNGEGQTMVVLPEPVPFRMGSPPSEAGHQPKEQLHRRRIGRTFALAAKPVTLEQFKRCHKNYRKGTEYYPQYAPTEDCPVHGTDWYSAAGYCNWLSEQEGIPPEQWCYQPNSEGKYAEGMSIAPNYLQRTGYRLPTEAEWEYACRAGAVTSRHYGETEELLAKYGWYLQNASERSWPVGLLKPNDFGLFDMHAHLWVWCQEVYRDYPKGKEGQAIDDNEDLLIVKSTDGRPVRGGSFSTIAAVVRCALRNHFLPSIRLPIIGFRPARTFPVE
jgi:formylglycine-generating enzyme required for sulfatase activity